MVFFRDDFRRRRFFPFEIDHQGQSPIAKGRLQT
jgi:hypothetical protein